MTPGLFGLINCCQFSSATDLCTLLPSVHELLSFVHSFFSCCVFTRCLFIYCMFGYSMWLNLIAIYFARIFTCRHTNQGSSRLYPSLVDTQFDGIKCKLYSGYMNQHHYCSLYPICNKSIRTTASWFYWLCSARASIQNECICLWQRAIIIALVIIWLYYNVHLSI